MLMPINGIAINTPGPQKWVIFVENWHLDHEDSETFKFATNTKRGLISNVDEALFT